MLQSEESKKNVKDHCSKARHTMRKLHFDLKGDKTPDVHERPDSAHLKVAIDEAFGKIHETEELGGDVEHSQHMEPVAVLYGHSNSVMSMQVAKFGKAAPETLITGSLDESVKLWNAGEMLEDYCMAGSGVMDSEAELHAKSQAGKGEHSQGYRATIRTADMKSVRAVRIVPDAHNRVTGGSMVYGDSSGKVREVSVDGKELPFGTPIRDLVDAPDDSCGGGLLSYFGYGAASGGGTEMTGGSSAMSSAGAGGGVVRGVAHAMWVNAIELVSSTEMITCGYDNKAKRWAVKDGEWVPDGVMGGKDGTHIHWVTCVQVQKSGKLMATGSRDKSIKLWDRTDSSRCKQHRTAHKAPVSAMLMDADHHILVTAGSDSALKLWDTRSLGLVAELRRCARTLLCVCVCICTCLLLLFSAARAMLRSCLRRMLMLTPCRLPQPPRSPGMNTAHGKRITSLAWASGDPDTRKLVSGSEDGFVKVWDLTCAAAEPAPEGLYANVPSGEIAPMCSVHTDGAYVQSLACMGNIVYGGLASGMIKVWRMPTSVVTYP